MRMVVMAGAMLALGLPTAATAEPAPLAAPAPDYAARRAEARAIIAVMFPPATREATVQRMIATLQDSMLQSMKLPETDDPGIKAFFADIIRKAQALSAESARASFPKTLEAMEGAYARNFTLAQLKDVHAFASTPSGALYLQRSLDLVSDPEIKAATVASLTESQAKMRVLLDQARADFIAYLRAHPEAAAKLSQAR